MNGIGRYRASAAAWTGAMLVATSGVASAAPPTHRASAAVAVTALAPAASTETSASTNVPAALAYLAPQKSSEYGTAALDGVDRATAGLDGRDALDAPGTMHGALRIRVEPAAARTSRPFAFLGNLVRSTNACRNVMSLNANANMGTFLLFRQRC